MGFDAWLWVDWWYQNSNDKNNSEKGKESKAQNSENVKIQ